MSQKSPLEAIQHWFLALPTFLQTGNLPARGSVAAGLVILERLKTDFSLEISTHRARGGAQLQGLNPSAVKKILDRFGETRAFLKEGGRTNRGTPLAAQSLLDELQDLRLNRLSSQDRLIALNDMQEWLAGQVREYFNRRRIEFEFDPHLTSWANVRNVLVAAETVGKAPPVAQYLVGAKLQLRFPEIPIQNELASAADDPTGRLGDFEIGDTVFHVTISPGVNVVEKCCQNLRAGKRAVVLVPETALLTARDFVQHQCEDRVFVVSVETFIASNLEELSTFQHTELLSGFGRLLELYNQRVDEIELDKSLMIDIPPNLE